MANFNVSLGDKSLITGLNASGYDFYYDSMINSPDLTYRILGVKSTKAEGEIKKEKVEVILRDFIREPISFSVAHSYTNSGGGISSLITNFQTFLSQAAIGYERAKEMFKQFAQQIGISEVESLGSEAYARLMPWVDYYKTYQSTQVSIPLTFNARLYPRYIKNELVDVKSQVQSISDFFVGPSEKDSKNTGLIYYPPHGYSPSTAQLMNEHKLKGTLTLLYGKFAVIENLLLSSFSVNFSRELIRTGQQTKKDESPVYTPAYADVMIALEPSLMITLDDIKVLLASDFYATTSSNSWMLQNNNNLEMGKVSEYYAKYN